MPDDSMSLDTRYSMNVQPVEFRVLLFVNREGEPCARLQRTDVEVVKDQTGNVVTIAQLLLQMAETYEKAVELNEALRFSYDGAEMLLGKPLVTWKPR